MPEAGLFVMHRFMGRGLHRYKREIRLNSTLHVIDYGTISGFTYRKWSNNEVELWYAGTLTYDNGANSGILVSTNGNQLKVTSTKLTLPFKITNGIISSSVVWYFTEWTQA